MERGSRHLELGVFLVGLVVLVVGAGGGPGWGAASGHAAIAAQLGRSAASPLYGLLADLAVQLPAGEVGFRLGVLGAVLGAATLAGVVAAARVMLPKEPITGVIGALLLVLAPPFRDAAAFATPSLLAACGLVWAFAGAFGYTRAPATRRLVVAFVGTLAVIGSAPWLGAAVLIGVVGWLNVSKAPRDQLALGVGAVGVTIIALWLGALGSVPEIDPSLTAVVATTGRGAAAIVVGTGLLGAAFGAVTGLAVARYLALAIVVVGIHAIVVDHAPEPLLALLAVGCAIVPSGIARALPAERRTLAIVVAAVPLLGASLVTGATLQVDDPGDAPARLATDVIGQAPSGPGVIVATGATVWSAIEYAELVAGARPDLVLAPPMPPTSADAIVAGALRAKQLAVSDVPAFGRLDPALALARGRGFELRGVRTEINEPPPRPAIYASATGERQAVALAIARARYEAGNGRLDAAARALGPSTRFRAADFAMLATTAPTRERPALFGFLPRLDDPDTGSWRLDLFGDDLAWVAGIEQPLVDAPPSRKLHGLWREMLSGKRTPDDPEIAALGSSAVAATHELVEATRVK